MHIKPNVVVIQIYVDRSIFAREICENVVEISFFLSLYINSYKFWNWHTEAFNGNVMVSCSWKIRFLRQGSRIYFKNCLPIANEIKLSGYDRSKYDICQEIQSSKDSDLSEYLHLLRLSLQIPLNVYVWTFALFTHTLPKYWYYVKASGVELAVWIC